MNIVLIGYRGTGKSVVGRILADRLDMTLKGMDAMIVERAGMPIPQIVAEQGWPGFRDLESDLARELGAAENMVIDTGGGVIERLENVEALRVNGRVFWLTAGTDTIVERIQDDTQRPALVEGKTFTEEVAEVLERRTPLYDAAAHHTIATDTVSPEDVADAIISIWNAGG